MISTSSDENEVILEVKGIVKRFPGVTAIDHMDLKVSKGEIRAIMGENGAGKSTLCSIITGLYTANEGEIFFKNKKIAFSHPKEALAAGIRMVYQERNLIDFLTGSQSICLGLEDRKRRFFVDEKKMRQKTQDILKEIAVDIPIDVPINSLSPAQQQMLEIIRAISHNPELLILDEPTAALGNEEAEILFDVMRKLKAKGVAIMIITHKLEEVFEIADTISILRNGKHIVTVKNGEVDRMDVVKYMLGRDMSTQYPTIISHVKQQICLNIENLHDYSGKVKGVSFKVNKGEVLGIYGLLGSGRTEIMESIMGLHKSIKGRIYLESTLQNSVRPDKMIDQGIVLIPGDRRDNSIFRRSLTLEQNATLGLIKKTLNKFGIISAKKEEEVFNKIATDPSLRVKYAYKEQDIGDLSGGNQQKIILGRWIFKEDLKLVMLDEPTQGIDVGVKHDIYVLIRNLVERGISVLMVSSELPELTGVCDRIIVLRDGKIKGEFLTQDFDNEKILEMVL